VFFVSPAGRKRFVHRFHTKYRIQNPEMQTGWRFFQIFKKDHRSRKFKLAAEQGRWTKKRGCCILRVAGLMKRSIWGLCIETHGGLTYNPQK
jgi:hypothetical protein